jgi:hypothetical protein
MDSIHARFAKTTYPAGAALTRSGSDAERKYDIVGQYEAFVVVTLIDATIARHILATDFELAPPGDIPTGMHPVM